MTETAAAVELDLELEEEEDEAGLGATWKRSGQVADVAFPQREITVVVLPYESPALVEYQGRMVREVVSRGAFGNVQQRGGGRIKVNRDHDYTKPVGRVDTLYPNREEGLVATLKIAPTPAGEETLVLADHGVLDASASFGLLFERKTGRVYPDAEVWEDRNTRRLNRLWLDHVAMVMNPAYRDAGVLSVRSQPEQVPRERAATPHLDQVRAWMLEDRYSRLDV